jgi:hypothetical protein
VAEKLGGSSGDHERVLMALRMLVHGAAMLLIEKAILPEDAGEARAVMTASVAALLRAGDGL